ncbi:MAG TPA: hypothetical protein VF453_07650 [Burkholderiaceae bacterium]
MKSKERISVNSSEILQAAATIVSGRVSAHFAAGKRPEDLDAGLWLIEAMYLIEGVVHEFEENRLYKNPV